MTLSAEWGTPRKTRCWHARAAATQCRLTRCPGVWGGGAACRGSDIIAVAIHPELLLSSCDVPPPDLRVDAAVLAQTSMQQRIRGKGSAKMCCHSDMTIHQHALNCQCCHFCASVCKHSEAGLLGHHAPESLSCVLALTVASSEPERTCILSGAKRVVCTGLWCPFSCRSSVCFWGSNTCNQHLPCQHAGRNHTYEGSMPFSQTTNVQRNVLRRIKQHLGMPRRVHG